MNKALEDVPEMTEEELIEDDAEQSAGEQREQVAGGDTLAFHEQRRGPERYRGECHAGYGEAVGRYAAVGEHEFADRDVDGEK